MLRFVCLVVVSTCLAVGCGDDTSPTDAGPMDAGRDGSTSPCPIPEMRWSRESLGATVGVTRTVELAFDQDYVCDDADIALTSSNGPIASFPESVTIPRQRSAAQVEITADAVGSATLTATWDVRGETRTAELEWVVTEPGVPSCQGSASGTVEPGGAVRIGEGPMQGVGVALQAGAADEDRYHVDSFEVSVQCAGPQLPEGYRALGPAISLQPGYLRFDREIPVTLPIKRALLAEGAHRGHIEVAYTSPSLDEPRVVPVASPWFDGSPAAGRMHFKTPRLGTYQAVVDEDRPVRRTRKLTYRGITGVSMGGGGAAGIGLRNPERFDFVAPLGGPVDWVYMMHYIRTYHLGGFCTQQQRNEDSDGSCAEGASVRRTPPATELHEHRQDFEHWYYPDEYGGQGGTFDRTSYVNLFRDLAHMFGNPNTTRTADPSAPNITPPGVPDSRRSLGRSERCNNPVIIPPCQGTFPECEPGTGFADDEYNPEGQHPVITFCDGSNLRENGEIDRGVWDPEGRNDLPIEVALAVDINENGKRDRGEPVIRNVREPFEDCGLDGLCNPDEPGYDPETNPDPAGDDYDDQFNPTGTEGNWLRDSTDGDPCTGQGESFRDTGLDGVMGSAQLDEGGYDYGEGNGCWDTARGMGRMLRRNPRRQVLEHPREVLRNIDVFTDGGIRDLFNFSVAADHFTGAFTARDLPVRVFNSHAALDYEKVTDEDKLDVTQVPWDELGKYVMVRYGDPDATEQQRERGDGGHVGTANQIFDRLLSVMAWMSAKWPGGDRQVVQDRICTETGPGCDHVNQFTFEFTSPNTGRTGPVSMVLPPGYFDEEFQDTRYPVVYLGHGYGQEPQDLVATGILIWNFMTAQTIPRSGRIQKMIFVFPDGRCRGEECVTGTFFTDAPGSTPEGAKMETFLLDLMNYVDENYRTKEPETVEVVE